LAALSLATFQLPAQHPGIPSESYDWGSDAPWRTEWDTGTGATEVLEDELSIRLRNTKPEFLSLFFERRKVVRFTSEADIVRHGQVVLPESLDPVHDRQHVPWGRRDEPARPRWLNTRLDHFAARVLRPDGSWGELATPCHVERGELRTLRTIETVQGFVLSVRDIRPGDVVELRWKYMLPYDYNQRDTRGWRALEWMDNWARLTSWRVFFHGELPVRRQRVEVLYHPRHGLLFGGTPPNGREEEGNLVRAFWEHRDLPGCMGEVNARPALDLPHIILQLVPEDFRYWRRDRLSGIAFPQPYWLQVVRYREARAFWWRQVSRKRVPDKQNQLVKDFVLRTGGADSNAVRRMERVHEHVARHFRYEDDRLWYLDLDQGMQRIGEQVRDGRLRDNSRYDMYSKLLNTLRLDHATAYVLDKRVGGMTDLYLTPLWDSEYLFGVRDGPGALWMHPKRARYGLLAGELPFYWQGTAALLIDLGLLIEDIPPPPRFVEMPRADPAGNVRGIEYTVVVDLDGRDAEGLMRVFLSGQFSTLGRAAYMDAPIDSTVDPLYGWCAAGLEGVSSSGWEAGEPASGAPFRFRAEARIRLDGAITREPDGTCTIDLAPLIAHVVPRTFDAGKRTLPFYWDFPQEDRFRIEFRFSRPVELLDADRHTVRESTGTATLARSLFARSSRRLVMESLLVVDGEREVADGFPALERVLRAAAPDALLLRVRPLEEEP